MGETKIYASLHTHSRDLFDSQNNPDELCARFAELGAKGFALTQHGVLSAVEPMRKAVEKYGLKLVPGIETYYVCEGSDVRRHLILLAVDDIGYQTLCRAVTDANDTNGYSVMNQNILQQYFSEGADGHGHVIATSACIQGVVAVTLRENDVINKNIQKTKRHQEKFGINPEDGRLVSVEKKLVKINDKIEENKAAKEAAKKLANAKFGVRERQLNKMKTSGSESEDVIKKLEDELATDKSASEKAKEEYAALMNESKSLSKRKSALNSEYKLLKEKADRWVSDEKEIESLKASMATEEKLVAAAIEDAKWFNRIFGDGNFYMEVQNHGIDTEAYVYPLLAKIARQLNIPIVATNDIHTVSNSDDELLRRRILRSLRFGTGMEKPQVGDDQMYIKTDAELRDALLQILPEDVVDESINNIRVIFDRCNVTFAHENHYPVFQVKDGRTADEVLEDEARKGIPWRFPNGFPDERYEKRLEYELDIIKSMGYSNYHLVVKDYLEYGRELGAVPAERVPEAPFDIDKLREWKKENGWDVGFSIGPGRGSAVGSLVCYLLGITALDPIKYDLLFERFLNPERVSMPDIDSDLSNTIRQKVIEYVQYKYGEESVCGIMTTNAQAPKGTIRIATKYYGYEKEDDGRAFLSLADMIAKKVPEEPGISFGKKDDKGITLYEQLRSDYAENPDALEILRWAKVIEGIFTAYGAHAAGIVISDGTPIKNHIPLRWNEKLNEWTTQMDMVSVEENGYLKMDFLGLRTLDIITDCLKAIKKNCGVAIDPLNIPLDDAEVFKTIFCEGKTNSVFQFESSGMKNMLRRFQPSSFEDLIILVAMFRPGPLQYLDGVIEVKHGKKAEYITKELVPLLENTYGAIVFQEQVMQIFQDLAGYTLGGADQVRRAMSKKKAKVLAAERPIFVHGIDEEDKIGNDGKIIKGRHIKGCVANGITEQAANALFDQMTDFAKYAFNRSHAAVYALIGYYTGWLKLHYPAEFLMAALNWASIDGIPGLMQEAKKLGVSVKAPDVNKSESTFTVVNGDIIFGLGAVKSVGATADDIIAERRRGGTYSSFIEFFSRVNAKKDAVENLIKAGAFDCFYKNRKAMLKALPDIQKAIKKAKDYENKIESFEQHLSITSLMSPEQLAEYQRKNNMVTKAGKVKSSDAFSESMLKRKQNATNSLNKLKREIGEIKIDEKTPEDRDEKMREEWKYLGAYVTEHPLDQYPDSEELGMTPVAELTVKDKRVYGLIREIKIKNRKSDRKPMAFVTLEDKTGEIEVCVFTRQYERLHSLIYEGAVVIIEGNAQIEERNGQSTIKFFAEKMTPAKKRAKAFVMNVPSFYRFVLEDEKGFKAKYFDKNGHPFRVYDGLTGQVRIMKYRVSDEAIKLENVNEM